MPWFRAFAFNAPIQYFRPESEVGVRAAARTVALAPTILPVAKKKISMAKSTGPGSTEESVAAAAERIGDAAEGK